MRLMGGNLSQACVTVRYALQVSRRKLIS